MTVKSTGFNEMHADVEAIGEVAFGTLRIQGHKGVAAGGVADVNSLAGCVDPVVFNYGRELLAV